jgi:hypothetical protein
VADGDYLHHAPIFQVIMTHWRAGAPKSAAWHRFVDRAGAIAAIGLLVAVLIATFRVGLNGDVQFVFGGLRVAAGPDGWAFPDTFVHRPLAYRFVMEMIEHVASSLRWAASQELFEATTRIVAVGIAAATGAVVRWGITNSVGPLHGNAVGLAVGISLALATPWDFLQPEWMAAAATAASVGVALGTKSVSLGAMFGGALAVLAGGMKLTTAPYAVIAVLFVAMVSTRRAGAMVASIASWAVVFFAVVLLVPRELRWLGEMSALDPDTPLHRGFFWSDVSIWVGALASHAVLTPVIVLVPAAITSLALVRVAGRRRAGMWMVLVLSVLLAVTPMVVQNNGYLYHLAGLPVLAAAIASLAYADCIRLNGRAPLAVTASLPLLALTGLLIASADASWRAAYQTWILLGIAVVTVMLVALIYLASRRPDWRGWMLGAGTTAIGAALLATPAYGPNAAWSLDPSLTTRTNASWRTSSNRAWVELRGLSSEIGRDTPVTYLAYGSVAYDMGNPTSCLYPSPTFLRVAGVWPQLSELESYGENVSCITSPGARYVIIEPGWIRLDMLPASTGMAVQDAFDCGRALTAIGIMACPARPPPE